MCSAYEFYPEKIKVYWLRNGEVVTTDVTSTMEMANGDWFYQIHSELDYTPKSGEKISCVVEHASSTQPIVKDWSETKHLLYSLSFISDFGIFMGANRNYGNYFVITLAQLNKY